MRYKHPSSLNLYVSSTLAGHRIILVVINTCMVNHLQQLVIVVRLGIGMTNKWGRKGIYYLHVRSKLNHCHYVQFFKQILSNIRNAHNIDHIIPKWRWVLRFWESASLASHSRLSECLAKALNFTLHRNSMTVHAFWTWPGSTAMSPLSTMQKCQCTAGI